MAQRKEGGGGRGWNTGVFSAATVTPLPRALARVVGAVVGPGSWGGVRPPSRGSVRGVATRGLPPMNSFEKKPPAHMLRSDVGAAAARCCGSYKHVMETDGAGP